MNERSKIVSLFPESLPQQVLQQTTSALRTCRYWCNRIHSDITVTVDLLGLDAPISLIVHDQAKKHLTIMINMLPIVMFPNRYGKEVLIGQFLYNLCQQLEFDGIESHVRHSIDHSTLQSNAQRYFFNCLSEQSFARSLRKHHGMMRPIDRYFHFLNNQFYRVFDMDSLSKDYNIPRPLIIKAIRDYPNHIKSQYRAEHQLQVVCVPAVLTQLIPWIANTPLAFSTALASGWLRRTLPSQSRTMQALRQCKNLAKNDLEELKTLSIEMAELFSDCDFPDEKSQAWQIIVHQQKLSIGTASSASEAMNQNVPACLKQQFEAEFSEQSFSQLLQQSLDYRDLPAEQNVKDGAVIDTGKNIDFESFTDIRMIKNGSMSCYQEIQRQVLPWAREIADHLLPPWQLQAFPAKYSGRLRPNMLPRTLTEPNKNILKRLSLTREKREQMYCCIALDGSTSMRNNKKDQRAVKMAVLLAEISRLLEWKFNAFVFDGKSVYQSLAGMGAAGLPDHRFGGYNNDAAAIEHARFLADQSNCRHRLLVMISDGKPCACSQGALNHMVQSTQKLANTRLVQIAVDDIDDNPFGNDFFPVTQIDDPRLPLELSNFLFHFYED